jgi:hypothetical protein
MSVKRHSFLLLLVTLVFISAPAFASHSWGGYHWARTANPFTLKVHDNVTSVWEPFLAEAQSDWNQSTVLDLNVLWQSPVSNVKRCTSVSGQIEVCNAKYGNNGWLGIAGISITGGTHITKGYTKLNDTYFNTSTYNTPAWRRMVTCQEIGHDFGLDHQDETFNNANLGSCMDYTNDPDGGAGGASSNDPSNEHPNSHDYAQIESIYAHLDSTTTISSVIDVVAKTLSRPQTLEEIMADAGQWGMPIRFDKQGRPNVFVLPIGVDHEGNPELQLTHVLWAPVDPFERLGDPHEQE